MAVPTYDELLARSGIDAFIMEHTFEDNHLRELSLIIDKWERLARSLELPKTDIESISRQRDVEEQRDRMLECWKQRCGSAATYEMMTKALLRINRTDLAEKVAALRLTSSDAQIPEVRGNKPRICNSEPCLNAPPSSVSQNDRIPLVQGIIPSLKTLEEDFQVDLVTKVEVTLEENEVEIEIITRRFRMLPQSVRRQLETDERYEKTRQKILDLRTIKDL